MRDLFALLVGILILNLPSIGAARAPNPFGVDADLEENGSPHRLPILRVGERVFLAGKGNVLEASSSSAICLTCHDGTVGSGIVPESTTLEGTAAELAVSNDISAYYDPFMNHLVGVPYPVSNSAFVPIDQLHPGLLLENGRVECGTCHGGSGGQDLSVPIEGSELCLACHRK